MFLISDMMTCWIKLKKKWGSTRKVEQVIMKTKLNNLKDTHLTKESNQRQRYIKYRNNIVVSFYLKRLLASEKKTTL